MIGRDVETQFPPKPARPRPAPLLEVKRLPWEPRLKSVDVAVGRGEIVGLSGLDGQGQGELLLALFGVCAGSKATSASARPAACPASPAAAKSARVRTALVPEDRKTEGLMLARPIADNLLAASWAAVSRGPFIDEARATAAVDGALAKLRIKIGRPEDPVATLSGGNQQKVVIAKWLMVAADLILLYDPTRGIDVGTKQELYRLMRELADAGRALLFFSTDLRRDHRLCDRALGDVRGRHPHRARGRRPHRGGDRRGLAQPRHRRVSRLRLAVTQNRGFVGACLLFAALFILYNLLHPRGFSSAVLIQNANKSVAIAFVAMAQTIPVLLGGLDLSVGAVMTLANCIASELVHGTPAQIVLGMLLTLLAGAASGSSTA